MEGHTCGKVLLFSKYQAGGDDFVIVNNMNNKYPFLTDNTSLISRLLDRNFGIGGNAFIELLPCPGFAYYMNYYNKDGSRGAFCGNGSLSTGLFAFNEKIATGKEFFYKTVDGAHKINILGEKSAKSFVQVQIESMAKVKTLSDVDYFIDMGNAHHVRFVENLANYPVRTEGPVISKSKEYKDIGGTNANFVKEDETDDDTRKVHVRTYEHEVGDEILACGSASVAVAMVAYWRQYEQANDNK